MREKCVKLRQCSIESFLAPCGIHREACEETKSITRTETYEGNRTEDLLLLHIPLLLQLLASTLSDLDTLLVFQR